MDREERFVNLLNTLGNLGLTILKLTVGTVAHSQAVLADGVHNAADILASAAVYIGVRVARVPPDVAHPYGHQKAEAIAEDVVGVLLILAGVEILITSVEELLRPTRPLPGILAVVAMALSILVKEVLYRYSRVVGKRRHSRALLAVALDHRTDVFGSLAALLGAGGARLGLPWLDPLAGGLVSLLVVHSGWSLVVQAVDHLMDKFDDTGFLETARQIGATVPGVERVEGLRARAMGAVVLIDVEIAVRGDLTVDEGHRVAHHLSMRLREQLPSVEAVHVHVNPARSNAEGLPQH